MQQITSLESAPPTIATPTPSVPTSATPTSASDASAPNQKSESGESKGVGGVRGSASGGQTMSGVSGSLTSVSGSDLDLMASHAAGVGDRSGASK